MGTTNRIVWRIAIAACTAFALAACGAKTRSVGGTDSSTHWLTPCTSSAECGELQCVCGLCTEPCESSASCERLDARASCATGGACEFETACALECTGDDDCAVLGERGQCRSGRCARTAVGMPTEDAGSNDAGLASCRPMDARSGEADCALSLGFAWDGKGCREVLCTCVGEDCDALWPTEQDCELSYRFDYDCRPLTACTDRSDCTMRQRGCCACANADPLDVLVLATTSEPDYEARVCDGSEVCTECEGPSAAAHQRYQVTCDSASTWEGNECYLADLHARPCDPRFSGCRVAARGCCPCGDVTLDDVFAIADDSNLNALFCDSEQQACPDCELTLPENLEARCNSSSWLCELFQNGERVR